MSVFWRRNSAPSGSVVFKATYNRLDPFASLLVGVLRLCGVGILEGFPPCWRDAERGVPRVDSPTVSEASEHTDWMSEMSKSEASLPLRLLPLLPALLPGRLEFLLDSVIKPETLSGIQWLRLYVSGKCTRTIPYWRYWSYKKKIIINDTV